MEKAGQMIRSRGLATPDGLFGGRLRYRQPANGFRTAVDSLALAHICEQTVKPPPARVLDVGCGSGFLSLIAGLLWPQAEVLGVDISEERIDYAEKNISANGMVPRVQVYCANIVERRIWSPHSFDLVVSNPPFHPVGTGTLPKDPSQAVARFELFLDHEQLVEVAAEALAPGGRFLCMYPPERVSAVKKAARNVGLEIREIYPISVARKQPVFREILVLTSEGIIPADPRSKSTVFLESEDGNLGPSLAVFVDQICDEIS